MSIAVFDTNIVIDALNGIEQAVIIRKQRKIRLPDAIIKATAQVHNALLVTRNTRDFPENSEGVKIPYKL